MSAIDELKAAFRKYVTDGVPASGVHEPNKDEITQGFERLRVELNGISAGLTIVSDTTARDAFFADEANQGKLVYVNNNNGEPDDPDNGVYEYVDGAARIAEGFYQGVASVVQPLVDEAQAAAEAAELAADAINPIRFPNQYGQPSFADGSLPTMRSGTPALVDVTAESLIALGAVKGVWNSAGTATATTMVKVPLPEGAEGQHVYMSAYSVNPTAVGASTNGPAFIDGANSLVTTGLTYGYELVEEGDGYVVERTWAFGVIPAGVTHLGLGRTLGARSASNYITGVTYGLSRWPLNNLNFFWDDLSPPLDLIPTAVALAAEGVDETINTPWHNFIGEGDFVEGVPSIRSSSPVVDLTHDDMLERGVDRGIQWRAGNEFFRYASGGSLLNKYFFAAFVVNSVDAANLITAVTPLKEDSTGGATSNPGSVVAGYVELSDESRIAWATGLINTDVPNFLVGSSSTPTVAGTRYASDVVLYLSDTAIDKDEALRQMNLAAKARKEARKWARSVTPDGPVTSRGTLVLAGDGGTAYVESDRSGHTIRNSFAPFPVASLTAIPCRFNIVAQSLDGVQIRTGATDDIAPDHVEGTTLDANHGYTLGRCTANAHGKTVDDEGSVWTNGGNDYVLVDVENANSLLIAKRTSNSVPPTGTFVHGSGATNTGDITVTTVDSIQWYPPHNNRTLSAWVDGGEVTDTEGEFPYSDSVVFVETVDILARQTIIDWWIANGGASAGVVPEGDPLYRSVVAYRFDRDGQMTIHRSWTFLDDTTVTDLMGLQVGRVDAPDTYRIPGAEPFTYDGDTVDYGAGVASDRTLTAAGTPSINFDSAKLQDTGEYAHRLISEWDDYAIAVGLAPVGDANYVDRRTNTATKAMEIRGNTAKVYFRVVDKGGFTAAAGDSFECIGFRHILPREAGRPLVCPVRLSDRKAIVYIDWADFAGFDQVSIPPDLIGRTVTILDSRNATLVGGALATGSVTANVSAGGDHGYLVLELAA